LKPNTPELQAEADEIIKLQSNITEAQIKEANVEAHLSPTHVFSAINGISDASKYANTHKLIDKVYSDCRDTYNLAKEYWKTERPYQVNDKIKALVEKPISKAYPSGHTSCSRVLAEVLGQILPAKRAELRERAAEIAYNRVIAGVHWPHDIEGGKETALLFFGALQQSEAYQADLKAAIAENSN
jgi:acid phosphatase (class A)